MRYVLLALALALALAAAAHAQPRPFLPQDAGADDPTFIAFRGRLIEAVARRDTAAVAAALAPDVKLSFGGDAGRDGFRRMWLADAARRERLWATLGRVLGMGSARTGGLLTAPYVYGAWPDSLDSFTHAAVVGEDVRVRASPGTTGRVIGAVGFSILPVRSGGIEGPGGPWAEVRLANGRTGYVAERFLWSPVGYRLGFERRDGHWLVTFFVAGD